MIQCLQCKTKHSIKFEEVKTSEVEKFLMSIVDVSYTCPQCGRTIVKAIVSTDKNPQLKCSCGISFPVSLALRGGNRKITHVEVVKEEPKRKDHEDKLFAAIGLTATGKKKRKYPIADEVQVLAALKRIDQKEAGISLAKIGLTPELVKINIFARAIELGLTEVIKANAEIIQQLGIQLPRIGGVKMGKKVKEFLRMRFASLRESVNTLTAALSSKEAEVTTLQASIAEKDQKVAEVQAAADEKVAKYLANATVIVARKAELGEKAKDMSDDDLLNEDKYKIASLENKIAAPEAELIKGSKKVDLKDTELGSIIKEMAACLKSK
jgi:predicted RNA-binding Zn-ribbon protein involved in translation (DUF1610 family)